VRLRDITASRGITERSAHGIVAGLAEAGYIVRQKDGRRDVVLALLAGTGAGP